MTRLLLTLAMFLAVAGPAAILHFAAPDDRLRAGLTAPGFAWPRVYVAHLLAAIPIGFVIPLGASFRGAVVAAVAGTVITLIVAPAVADTLDLVEAGFVARLVTRTTVASALVAPWMHATRVAWHIGNPCSRFGRIAAMLLAAFPPAVFANRVIEAHQANFDQFHGTGRLVRARWELAGLVELGSRQRVGDDSPVEALGHLDLLISSLAQRPPKATPDYAFVLVSLDRLDEAATLLEKLDTSTSRPLLGAVYRANGRWAEAEALYRQVLAASPDRLAYEGLAEALVKLRRPAEAEATLREAIQELPGDAAHFHFRLGEHYANGGRPARAMSEFAESVSLDPTLRPQVEPHERRLRTATPGCLLRLFGR